MIFWEWIRISYSNCSNTFIRRRSFWTAVGHVWVIRIWLHCFINVTLTLTLRLCHNLPICYFKIRWGRCWVNHHTRSGVMRIWKPIWCICPPCNAAVSFSLKLQWMIDIIFQYEIPIWAEIRYTYLSLDIACKEDTMINSSKEPKWLEEPVINQMWSGSTTKLSESS